MLRLTEALLFALPFIVFLVWRLTGQSGRLPTRTVVAAALSLAVLAVALAWFGLGRVLPPDAPYVPARLGTDGRIIGPDGGH